MGNAWEPPDAAKGQVARAIFYMACMYCQGGRNGQRTPLRLTEHDEGLHCCRGDGGPGYLGKLSVLLAWNSAFPPLDAEKKRNSTVERVQGNRNPFIDLPELANMVAWESSPPHPGILSQSLE
jgi:endonuclease I